MNPAGTGDDLGALHALSPSMIVGEGVRVELVLTVRGMDRAGDRDCKRGDTGVVQYAYTYDEAGFVDQRTDPTNGAQSVTVDSLGRPTTPLQGVAAGYDAGGRRVRMASGGGTLHFPAAGYEYSVGLGRVNKHFLVGGRRVASTAVTYAATPASLAPLLRALPKLPRLDPPPWSGPALWTLAGLLLLGLALRPRDGDFTLAERMATVATLLFISPNLMGMCGGGGGGNPTLGNHALPALFYATDHLGSTIVTVDDAGILKSRFLYTPYGTPIAESGLSVHDQFTGEHLDPSGLVSLGQRYYDPATGRLMQPDTIVPEVMDPQTLNRYAYAGNNPVNFVDPSGNSFFSKLFGVVKTVGSFLLVGATAFANVLLMMLLSFADTGRRFHPAFEPPAD